MTQDVSALVRGTKIRDLLFAGAVEACKQMQAPWHELGDEERDRMTGLIDAWSNKTETEIARRMGNLLEQFIASGQPSVAGAEKGISIEGSSVTIKIAAPRAQVPREMYTHKGSFLIVLTGGNVLSLEELNKQGEFFTDGEEPAPDSPIVAQYRASAAARAAEEEQTEEAAGAELQPAATSEPDENPADLYADAFLLALAQLTSADFAAQYDGEGEFAGIVGTYFLTVGTAAEWSPGEAAANESIGIEDRRLIADGPPRDAGEEGRQS